MQLAAAHQKKTGCFLLGPAYAASKEHNDKKKQSRRHPG